MIKSGRNSIQIFLLLAAAVLPPQAFTYASPVLQSVNPPACSGSANVPIANAPCKHIQIVFIIDDSGSMGFPFSGNDLQGRRFESMLNSVDLLADVYLDAVEARARVLPQIHIAAIHFATGIIYNSGWVQVAPPNRAAWERATGEAGAYKRQTEEALIDAQVRNLVYNAGRERRTDFRNPIREAADLLEAIDPPDAQGCPNRLVFVLTDGAPDEGQGELHRFLPASRAQAALDAHFGEVRRQAARIESPIYVLAFRHSDRTYWDATQDYWRDGIATDAIQVEVGNAGDTGELPNLLDFVRGKVEQEMVGTGYTIPAYLESLQVNYAAPNALARLEIIDPEGNLLVPDGESVALSGEGTTDQQWTIRDAIPGDYAFKPLDASGAPLPGGNIELVFIYPAPETGMHIAITSPHLQQFTRGEVSFQLVDPRRTPLQFSERAMPRFAATFSPADSAPRQMDLIPVKGKFSIPDVLPLSLEPGTLEVGVIVADQAGNECLLYHAQTGEAYQVDPVRIVAQPSNPAVCAPSGMPVSFPLTLVDANDNPTRINLPISWQVDPLQARGGPVEAHIRKERDPGAYQFSLSAQAGGDILAQVSANVTNAGTVYRLYEDTFEFSGLIQDHAYGFEAAGVASGGEARAEGFIRTFAGGQVQPYGQVLVGRRWFGWGKDQPLRVSGRFYDKESGEAVSGIERFRVQLAPAGSAQRIDPTQGWQQADDGGYFVAFEAPGLGDYDLVVSDQGETLACTSVSFSGARITLVRDAGEYILIIALTGILVILLIVVLLWLYILPRRAKLAPENGYEPRRTPYGPPLEAPQEPEDERKRREKKEGEDKDDLKVVEGIGPKVEKLLNDADIKTYQQLGEAESRMDEIRAWLEAAGYQYMDPGTWPQQARLAADGDWDGLHKLQDRLIGGRPPLGDVHMPGTPEEPDEAEA